MCTSSYICYRKKDLLSRFRRLTKAKKLEAWLGGMVSETLQPIRTKKQAVTYQTTKFSSLHNNTSNISKGVSAKTEKEKRSQVHQPNFFWETDWYKCLTEATKKKKAHGSLFGDFQKPSHWRKTGCALQEQHDPLECGLIKANLENVLKWSHSGHC